MTLTCAYVVDGFQCEAKAEVRGSLALCDDHHVAHHLATQGWVNVEFAKYFAARPSAPHSPGFTYIVLVPGAPGAVKIGYSESLAERFKTLHRKLGGRLVPLAVLDGGLTREREIHHKFSDERLSSFGEMFSASDRLLTFALKHGIHADAREAVAAYAAYKAS